MLREMFKEVSATQKKRPTKTLSTHEDLRELDIVENKTKFMLQNLGTYKIFKINIFGFDFLLKLSLSIYKWC